MISEFIYFITICVLGLWVFNVYSRPSNYPPGPWNFPLFGAMLQVILSNKTFPQKMEEWRTEYGDVVSLNLGTKRTIVIHGIDLMKKTFSRNELVAKPLTPAVYAISTKNLRGNILWVSIKEPSIWMKFPKICESTKRGKAPPENTETKSEYYFGISNPRNPKDFWQRGLPFFIGLMNSEGRQWDEQRRFTIKSLRNLGVGKTLAETSSHDNLRELLNELSDLGHSSVVPTRLITIAIINSLWNILAGKTLGFKDPKVNHLFDNARKAASGFNLLAFASPWFQKLVPKLSGFGQFQNSIQPVREFIRDQIMQHYSTYQDDNARDFMDLYIKEIKATTNPESSFYANAGEENMLVSLENLFSAGSDPTSWIITWGLYFLTDNPAVQKKFANEISEIIGNSRLPSLNDRESMPYTNAVILEIFRATTSHNFSLPHRCTVDIMIKQYNIPANTTIMINLYDLHHNKEVWGDPENFRPERFLLMDEKTLDQNVPTIAPFSVGKRVCFGEHIARNNIFIILTGIIQKFCVRKENPMEKHPLEKGVRFHRIPPPIKLIFEQR